MALKTGLITTIPSLSCFFLQQREVCFFHEEEPDPLYVSRVLYVSSKSLLLIHREPKWMHWLIANSSATPATIKSRIVNSYSLVICCWRMFNFGKDRTSCNWHHPLLPNHWTLIPAQDVYADAHSQIDDRYYVNLQYRRYASSDILFDGVHSCTCSCSTPPPSFPRLLLKTNTRHVGIIVHR